MNSLRYIGGQVDTIVDQLAGDTSLSTKPEQNQDLGNHPKEYNLLPEVPSHPHDSADTATGVREGKSFRSTLKSGVVGDTGAVTEGRDHIQPDQTSSPGNSESYKESEGQSSDDEDSRLSRGELPSPLSLPFAEEDYQRPPLWKVVFYIIFFQWSLLAEVLKSGAAERSGPPGDKTAQTFVFTPDLDLLADPNNPAASTADAAPKPSALGSSTRKPNESSAGTDLVQRRRRRASSRSSMTLLKSPLSWRDNGRKTLVLDLDETLIHSMARNRSGGSARMIEVEFNTGIKCIYFVEKRPFCDYFLDTVCKWFDLVVYTASVQSYADPMIDWLDPLHKYFSRRLYRSDCIPTGSGYVKDLTRVRSDLGRVMLVDNSPVSFELQKNNGIGIEGWIADPTDQGLVQLLPLLNALRLSTDVRSVLCLQHGEAFAMDPANGIKG